MVGLEATFLQEPSMKTEHRLGQELRELMEPFPVLRDMMPLGTAGETRTPHQFLTRSIAKMQASPPGSKFFIDFVGVGGISKSTNLAAVIHILKRLTTGNFNVLVEEFADAITLYFGERKHEVTPEDYFHVSHESAWRARMAWAVPVERLGYDPDSRLVVLKASPGVTEALDANGNLIGVRRDNELLNWQANNPDVRKNTFVFANTASPRVEEHVRSVRLQIEAITNQYHIDHDRYKAIGMIKQVLDTHGLDYQLPAEKMLKLHDSWASVRVMDAHRSTIADNMITLFNQGMIEVPGIRAKKVTKDKLLKNGRIFNQLYGAYLRHRLLERYQFIPDQVYFGNNTRIAQGVQVDYDQLDGHTVAERLFLSGIPHKLIYMP